MPRIPFRLQIGHFGLSDQSFGTPQDDRAAPRLPLAGGGSVAAVGATRLGSVAMRQRRASASRSSCRWRAISRMTSGWMNIEPIVLENVCSRIVDVPRIAA